MSVTNERVTADSLDKNFDIRAEFPLPDMETWRKLAEASLKGGSYEKKLLTQTLEGIQLEPIYTAEHLSGADLEQLPGYADFIRGTQESGHLCKSWQIAQELSGPVAEEVGALAEQVGKKGQNALVLNLHPSVRCGDPDAADPQGTATWAHTLADFRQLLGNLSLQDMPVHIDGGVNGLELLSMMVARQQALGQPVEALEGSLLSDPLGVLNQTGKLSQDLSSVLDKAAWAVNWADGCCTKLRTLGVNGLVLREAGADVVMELASMLAMGTTYVDEMIARGLSLQAIVNGMAFTSGVGPFYFMEIAKFRALRALWARIISAYGDENVDGRLWVRAQTSTYEWTRYDRHVNLLRATTEAFAAVVGGVDALTVTPFCRPTGEEDDLARRISRNIQIILRDESHLDRVIDPAGGSYYVEWLTRQLIDKAWALFVEIDEAGGYLEELKNGGIQNRIHQARTIREKDLAKRKQILVGVNAYANTKEEPPSVPLGEAAWVQEKRQAVQRDILENGHKMNEIRIEAQNTLREKNGDVVHQLAKAYLEGESMLALNLGELSPEPIQVTSLDFTRLAEDFEALRDRTAKRLASGKGAVRVLLLTLGTMTEHKARAEFSKAFMEIAGFEVLYPEALPNAEAVLNKVREVKPQVVVLCSTDERYGEWVSVLAQPLKSQAGLVTVLAGYPREQVEAYRQAGIDEFIYLGCDAVKTLCDIFDKSEVK
jgi:methylmalonyl-CoA mutase